MACRGGHGPPGTLRRRGVPGTMQASSPTEVRYNAGVPFGRGPSVGRRGGIYCARRRVSEANRRAGGGSWAGDPARGCLRRRGVRRDEGHPALRSPGHAWPSRLAGRARMACRGGPWPPGDPAPPPTGRIWNPPLRRAAGTAFPRLAAAPPYGPPRPFQNRYGNAPPGLLAGPGRAFALRFVFNAPGIRPRGRQGCGGLSRGCRSCARRCAAAARRAAKR